MEDYAGACRFRLQDVDALLAAVGAPRCVGAVHVGGVAVECRLKALIVLYHRINEWGDYGQRPKDSLFRSPIANPGHSLLRALKMMPDVWKRALSDFLFLKHLGAVIHPVGATAIDFISMRYSAQAVGGTTLTEWKRSFRYVVEWLNKNEAIAK